MKERIVTLPADNTRWPEYTWLEPAQGDLQLPLDLLVPDLHERYAFALCGSDSLPKYICLMRVMLRQRYGTDPQGREQRHVQVWVMPTKYTQSKMPRMVAAETITHLIAAPGRDIDDHVREFLQRALYRED